MAKRTKSPIDASAMSAEQLATVLSRASATEVRAATIEADLAAGAPRNADGTVNLVRYAAWLLRQASTRDRGDGGA